MKLSELSTDGALDVLCELTPYIDNIVNDQDLVMVIGKVVVPNTPLNQYGNYALMMGRISEAVPLLLKTHRSDVYGILSIMNGRTVAEIAAQKLTETVRQMRELLQDEELVAFFKSSAQQEKTEPSAPSADSPASE